MKKITKGLVMAVAAALLLFGCKNPTRWVGAVLESEGENPSEGIPFENGKYISATGTSEGIKITFADNVSVKAYNSISVDGIPIKIDTSVNDEKDDRKTYIFPFAEKGKTYVVTYSGGLIVNGVDTWVSADSVQCVAGGGLRYTDYLDLNSLYNSDTTVSYDPDAESDRKFSGVFKPYFTKDDVIKNDSIFTDFKFSYAVVLGEVPWGETTYWAWAHEVDSWVDSSISDEEGLSRGFEFISEGIHEGRLPTEQDWIDHDYKYGARVSPNFILKAYSDTTFLLEHLWSTQQTYTPSN